MAANKTADPPRIRLQVDDEIKCVCGKWHPLFSQTSADQKPAANAMLFFKCRGGGLYYGGAVGHPSRPRTI